MGRAHEKWHICKCLIFHAKNLLKVYNQKNSGYTKSRRKIRQQKIPKIDSKFLHIELLSREAWTSKDTRFLTLSKYYSFKPFINCPANRISSFSLCTFLPQIPQAIAAFFIQFVNCIFHSSFVISFCSVFPHVAQPLTGIGSTNRHQHDSHHNQIDNTFFLTV